MPLGHVPGEVFQACSTGLLGDVLVSRRSYKREAESWASLLTLLPLKPRVDKQQKMDGWMGVHYCNRMYVTEKNKEKHEISNKITACIV